MHVCGNIYGFIWDSMAQNNCNTFLVDGCPRILIDPGHLSLFDHVEAGLSELGLGLRDIGLVICTHAHPDHLEAVQRFRETSAQVAYHASEWELVKSMVDQYGAAFQLPLEAVRPDFFLTEGDLQVGDTRFQVYHTPGHAPGAICLYQETDKALVTGDLIFKDGVGRTDVPGGDSTALKESIRRMAALDVEVVLPGHGPVVSGAQEVRQNFQVIESFWFAHL